MDSCSSAEDRWAHSFFHPLLPDSVFAFLLRRLCVQKRRGVSASTSVLTSLGYCYSDKVPATEDTKAHHGREAGIVRTRTPHKILEDVRQFIDVWVNADPSTLFPLTI